MARPRQLGGGFQLKATVSDRGKHPDLRDDDQDDDKQHLLTAQQRADREYDQRYIDDSAFRKSEEEKLRPTQERLPHDIRHHVDGRTFAGTPSEGRRNYYNAIRAAARQSNTVLESQIEAMSSSEYDHYFDERGVIRPGYRLVYDRAQGISDIADLAHRTHYASAGYLQPLAQSALDEAERQAANRGGSYVIDRRADAPMQPYEDTE